VVWVFYYYFFENDATSARTGLVWHGGWGRRPTLRMMMQWQRG